MQTVWHEKQPIRQRNTTLFVLKHQQLRKAEMDKTSTKLQPSQSSCKDVISLLIIHLLPSAQLSMDLFLDFEVIILKPPRPLRVKY